MQTPLISSCSSRPCVLAKSCRITFLLCLLAMLGMSSAQATLLLYDGFDYPTNTIITGANGGIGWTNAWSAGGNATNISGSLSYADGLGNLLVTTGGRLFLNATNGTAQPQRDF